MYSYQSVNLLFEGKLNIAKYFASFAGNHAQLSVLLTMDQSSEVSRVNNFVCLGAYLHS